MGPAIFCAQCSHLYEKTNKQENGWVVCVTARELRLLKEGFEIICNIRQTKSWRPNGLETCTIKLLFMHAILLPQKSAVNKHVQWLSPTEQTEHSTRYHELSGVIISAEFSLMSKGEVKKYLLHVAQVKCSAWNA